MKSSEVELVVADLAAGQWGLVTTPQAVAAGLSRIQLARLCTAGILIRLTQGVYAVRAAMATDKIELYAAWLALDPARSAADRLADGLGGPVVSHASAAALYGYGDLDADRHEFTTPARKQTRRADLRLHRGELPENDVTLHRGLPATTPARTIVDLLAAGHDGGHVAGVLADAVRARVVDLDELGSRLAPFAARFGLARGDGKGLLKHLLELGGVSEQADADELASLARASHLPVAAVIAALADQATQSRIADFGRVLASPEIAAALASASSQWQQAAEMQATVSAQMTPSRQLAQTQAAIAAQMAPHLLAAEQQAAIAAQQLAPFLQLQEGQKAGVREIASVAAQQVPPLGLAAAEALALALAQPGLDGIATPKLSAPTAPDNQTDSDDQTDEGNQ